MTFRAHTIKSMPAGTHVIDDLQDQVLVEINPAFFQTRLRVGGQMKYFHIFLSFCFLHGCGLSVPQVSKSTSDVVFIKDVHYRVFCETIEAVQNATASTLRLSGKEGDFYRNWGLLYNLSLTTVENSAFRPTATASDLESPATSPQTRTVFTLGTDLGYSSKATSIQTSQIFSSVQRLRELEKCEPINVETRKDASGDPIPRENIVPAGGNLGVSDWLINQVSLVESGLVGSLTSKEAFTYRVEFEIDKTAGISPAWSFVRSNILRASAPLSGGRRTTHSVLFTFGPTDGARQTLSSNALSVHNARLVADAIQD